jgi:saccharopine dehydrogenase-like NADP-dependent oxidoreductase
MKNKVLIIGGRGRIGNCVAQDLATFTDATITITGRTSQGETARKSGFNFDFLPLDLADKDELKKAVSAADLVIFCAGPFLYRDTSVLQTCIEAGVNYLDISDSSPFTRQILTCREDAQNAGITAIINSGIFPGISNSMVRQGVEALDEPDRVHLSYVVGGSGGAGVTVMRTTFLGLQKPFDVWLNGKWETVNPYEERESIVFPEPYGKTGVYWFDMPEAFTLPESFTVKTVITKFGTIPDFYNFLTWTVARWWPPFVLKNPGVIEFLSYVSFAMTRVTDPFSGIGVAVRSEVTGKKDGKPAKCCTTMVHPNTAIVAGIGTGTIAQLMLEGKLDKPGVWPVEQILPTDLFQAVMASRNITINQDLLMGDW